MPPKSPWRRLTEDRRHIVEIDGLRLNFRSDWDIVGILENNAVKVYRQDLIEAGSTVLDLGAGIGDFTLIASKKVGPTGKVIAVEPNPHDYSVLLDNLRTNNCSNVVAMNVAVSSSKGVDLFDFKGESFSAHSRTLEDILAEAKISQVDFVKMDVEGFESRVIPPSIGVFSSVRYIAIELHGNQDLVRKILARAGFEFEVIDTPLTFANLTAFVIRHPLLSCRLYSRLASFPAYRLTQLARRVVHGLDIAQEGALMVGVFVRSHSGLADVTE